MDVAYEFNFSDHNEATRWLVNVMDKAFEKGYILQSTVKAMVFDISYDYDEGLKDGWTYNDLKEKAVVHGSNVFLPELSFMEPPKKFKDIYKAYYGIFENGGWIL